MYRAERVVERHSVGPCAQLFDPNANAAQRTASRQASVEGVQSKLQRIVSLALEHVCGDATEGRRLAILVLALGAPVCRAVDDLVIAPRVNNLQFVVRYAVLMQPREKLLDCSGT